MKIVDRDLTSAIREVDTDSVQKDIRLKSVLIEFACVSEQSKFRSTIAFEKERFQIGSVTTARILKADTCFTRCLVRLAWGQFQLSFSWKRNVCNNFCGIVLNHYSQVLLISFSVFSTLLERSTLVIQIPLTVEYRLLGLEFKETTDRKISI